jgi:hypothetical protein
MAGFFCDRDLNLHILQFLSNELSPVTCSPLFIITEYANYKIKWIHYTQKMIKYREEHVRSE